MSTRFDYIKYDPTAEHYQSAYKEIFVNLEQLIESHLPGRAQALALTSLEQTYMWIGKMIRDEQIMRLGPQADVPERDDV